MSEASHVIRLRAAWRHDAASGVAERRFHRPTGLEGGDRVWLVFDEPAPAGATVALNGGALALDASRADITEQLEASNELRVDASGDVGLWVASAQLEIVTVA
ncbi:hypothetical protein Mal64_38870 [Pseudobythopirellula maris]|uniref:Quercetin 2,3-dioxygenase C-terminal cupin domain-containing protein n=1 Tax=Pseudobythopirellula maris TaxID=2527991 RepID=A0A5C5ZGG3_9BACT|nr:hypothetical protein [Pseudobythopirellula maris]TWT86147.1 hypothetical protein Mal64_38870 [Pseudobythopirellula maris]